MFVDPYEEVDEQVCTQLQRMLKVNIRVLSMQEMWALMCDNLNMVCSFII